MQTNIVKRTNPIYDKKSYSSLWHGYELRATLLLASDIRVTKYHRQYKI